MVMNSTINSAKAEAIEAPTAPQYGINMRFSIKFENVPANTEYKKLLSLPILNNICVPVRLLNPVAIINKLKTCIGNTDPVKSCPKKSGMKVGAISTKATIIGIAKNERTDTDLVIKEFISSCLPWLI